MVIANSDDTEPDDSDRPWSALWTRGDGCAELAALLDGDAQRVQGDLTTACVDAGASLLITKRLNPAFDVTNVAIPRDLDLSAVDGVAALVAGGANSLLAAQIAATLSDQLGVRGRMLSAYADEKGQSEALTVVEQLYALVPTLEYQAVLAVPPADLVAQLGARELMVVGAPLGSWLQRQFFGQGARLVSHAPAGSVVVQSAPDRVFRYMDDPTYVSRHLGAGDAHRLHKAGLVAVVEDGLLIGVVERSRLLLAGDGAPVEACMSEPISIGSLSTVEEAARLSREHGNVPVPVVDGDGFLVGMIHPSSR